jgi:diguanylate cyclase (GGDEF)-like protein/PAS domain S-box-containing protein
MMLQPRAADEDESILALIARTMPALLWTVDAELAFRSSTGTSLELDGWSDNGLEGVSLFDYFGRDPAHPALAAHRRALAGDSVAFEMEIENRLFRAFVEPRRDRRGRIDGVTGFAIDATSERRALSSLRRSEEALALAQAAAHLGSWTHDLATENVTWSDELFALCGLQPGEREPTPALLMEFVHADDRLALEAAIEFAREEGRPFVIDTRLLRANGGLLWVQHRGRYAYDGAEPLHVVGTVLDITPRKRAEDHLAYQSNYDELTGLPNRKLLADRLRQAMLQAQHGGTQLAVLYVDLDRFKAINDTLGHAAGDRFLRMVAPRLIEAVRETDTVARSGGDEFVIVLPDLASVRDAARSAERIIEAFGRPVPFEGRELYSSASIGISIFPDDGESPEELIRNADAALNRAKSGGNGKYRFYASATHARAVDRLDLEHGLRRAYERDEFVVYYQPIVDRSERPVAVEALLRWEHPERGAILPDHFIPLCEETELIVPIGRRVMRRAFAQLAAWNAAGLTGLRMALNISGRQILHPDLTSDVEEALAESGVAPEQIEFEITESGVMADVAGARRTILGLKALGLRISLDDFGTGYSSLSYLKHFSVDALKIDRTFVRDLPLDRGDSAIVSAVVALGHAMGLSVVAEGVETAEQADDVRRLGCDEMQGYYFSRPARPEMLQGLLGAWRR